MRVFFLTAVVITVVALGIVLRVLVVFDLFGVGSRLTGEEIGFLNLLIDIALGVFTIWGLFWAASEFAKAQVKPDLCMVIGKEEAGGVVPLTNEADALIGRDTVSHQFPVSKVIAGLFLENTQPKAARYVQVVLRVLDVPRPESVDIRDYHGGLANFRKQDRVLSFSFGEDLVVYKGEMAYLGSIAVTWRRGTHPERITFVARLCSLEGEPKEVTVSHPIHWIEKAT